MFRLIEGASPAIVMEPLILPKADMTFFRLNGVEHDLGLAGNDSGVFASVEEPDGSAADAARVFQGQDGGFAPAIGSVAPENSGGGDGDGRPAVRVVLG